MKIGFFLSLNLNKFKEAIDLRLCVLSDLISD